MCADMCLHVHMYVYMYYMCVYTSMYIYFVYPWISVYACGYKVCMSMCTCMHMNVYTCVPAQFVQSHFTVHFKSVHVVKCLPYFNNEL